MHVASVGQIAPVAGFLRFGAVQDEMVDGAVFAWERPIEIAVERIDLERIRYRVGNTGNGLPPAFQGELLRPLPSPLVLIDLNGLETQRRWAVQSFGEAMGSEAFGTTLLGADVLDPETKEVLFPREHDPRRRKTYDDRREECPRDHGPRLRRIGGFALQCDDHGSRHARRTG